MENLLRHPGEVNNSKQMVSDELMPNTQVVVEPKAKKKYKTKKEKREGHCRGRIDDNNSNHGGQGAF